MKSIENEHYPGIRICYPCYERLASPTVITITKDEANIQAIATSGKVISEITLTALPPTLSQFCNIIKCYTVDECGIEQSTRMATDGYAYTKVEFDDYYGDSANLMWYFAQCRTIVVKLVQDDLLMNEDMYQRLRSTAGGHNCDATKLCELAGMHKYVAPYFWPHEPTRPAQGTPAQKCDWVQVMTESEYANAMFAVQSTFWPRPTFLANELHGTRFAYRLVSKQPNIIHNIRHTQGNYFLYQSGLRINPVIAFSREYLHQTDIDVMIFERVAVLHSQHGAFAAAAWPARFISKLYYNLPHHQLAKLAPSNFSLEEHECFLQMNSKFPCILLHPRAHEDPTGLRGK